MKRPAKNLSSEIEFFQLKGFLSFLILHELNCSQMCGDELSSKIGKRKGTKLTPGTIYPTLKRLRKFKLVSYKRNGRRKVYSLTELGAKEIERLYFLFGNYFYGLKDKVAKKPQQLEIHVQVPKKDNVKTIKNA